jgi:hypothetical protein
MVWYKKSCNIRHVVNSAMDPYIMICGITSLLYIDGVVVIVAINTIVAIIVTVSVNVMSAFPYIPSLTPTTKPLLIFGLCRKLLLHGGAMKLIPSSTISTIGHRVICT